MTVTEVVRSMKICQELEQEFGLIPLKKGERQEGTPIKKIDYKAGDLKYQVGNVVKSVMKHFYFQSFGEYRTLLEQFNVAVEEINGIHNGVVYSVIDEKGNKMGRPFKSSLFGKEIGFEALQKHYETSKIAVEKKKIRENMKPMIAKAMKQASSIKEFQTQLKKENIGVIFRQNEQGRIYGVTFIDYPNRAVLNGSRLGKEFSANVFNDLFNNQNRQVRMNDTTKLTKQAEPSYQSQSPSVSLGSAFSLLDFPQAGNDYEEEAFVRNKQYEAKRRRKKGRRL